MKSFAHAAAQWLSVPAVRRALQVAVAGLIVLFFALALYDLWPELTSYNWQFQPVYLVLALVVLVLRGPLPAYGWWAIVRAQTLHAASFGSYHAAAVALTYRYVRGRHQSRGQGL